MTKNELQLIIKKSMTETTEVIINSKDDFHFDGIIISNDFDKLSEVNRQKLIYSFIKKYVFSGEVHAFSMKTYTFLEWESK